MKKLFLTLALAFAGIFAANAQVWIGGGLGAQITKENTSLTVSPEIGYAFNNQGSWLLVLATLLTNQTLVRPMYCHSNLTSVMWRPPLAISSPCFSTLPATLA